MMDYGLSNEEMREFQAQLNADEFDALLQVQRQLLDEPMVAPAADLSSRVMTRLVERERRKARRRSTFGAIGFIFGSMIVTALVVWASPLGTLVQVSGWAVLLDEALSLFSLVTTLLVITRAFAAAFVQTLGSTNLVLFGFLALALTLIWTRVVNGPIPLKSEKMA